MHKSESVAARQEPGEWLAALERLNGVDFLRKIASGELPGIPMGAHFGLKLVSVEHGTVVFECHPDASHNNPFGAVHGGLVCTLLDTAVGCAAQSTLPVGIGHTSIELKVNYLRPVTADSGPLTCTGRVTKAGRRVTFAEGEVVDKAGRVVATASGTALSIPVNPTGT